MNTAKVTKSGFLKNNINKLLSPNQDKHPHHGCGADGCSLDVRVGEATRKLEQDVKNLQDQLDNMKLIADQRLGANAVLQDEVSRYKNNLNILSRNCTEQCNHTGELIDKILGSIKENKELLGDIFGSKIDYVKLIGEFSEI